MFVVYFFDECEASISVEVVVISIKVSTSWYSFVIWVICVTAMIVQSYIERCFCFSYVLYVAFSAFQEVYDIATFACGVVKYGVCLVGLLTLER